MVDFNALVKLINTNGDTTIQKSEVKKFLKTQGESIYTKYFQSIQQDVAVEEFKAKLHDIENQAYDENGNLKEGTNPELNFKKEKIAQQYEQIKQDIMTHDEMYEHFGWKFKSDEDFELAFADALKKSKESDDPEYVLWTTIETASSKTSQKDIMARINSGKFAYIPNDFQDIVFEDVDLSEYTEAFKYICFNEKTFANVSPEHLPAGFNPQEIFEKGKSIGLGIDTAHENGYTGEGVSFAVIDTGTICYDGEQHSGLNFKEYYVPTSAPENINDMHGLATSYIAQEIAPDADCYFYAMQFNSNMNAQVLENLKSILEKNKSLPDDKKIRFVSMSMPLYGGEESKEVVKELEAQGVWVFYSGCQEDSKMNYLEKINPNGDPNDFTNYQSTAPIEFTKRGVELYVNSGDRTVPDNSNKNAFRHDSSASQSWSIPVIAGYYTLACQADPSMTKEKFMELAEKTARTQESNFAKYDFSKNTENPEFLGRTEETAEIKIIDINALLAEIEKQKAGELDKTKQNQ